MGKIKINKKIPMYPMTVTLVGANVEDKANFLTVVWCSIVNFRPPLIAVVLNKNHYTNKGIKETKTFSINLPSTDMVSLVDYCSIVSGREADKSTIFTTFYGTLKTAPMISECPISLECKLIETIGFATHEIFIGEIIDTYTEEGYLTNELPDVKKIKPILYSMYDNNYWKLGESIGQAFHLGKKIKPEKGKE